MARTGRRPKRPPDEDSAASPDTRLAILAAARARFAQSGYDGASTRAIATAAGVDAALIHHYFGSKQRLFVAAMELPFDSDAVRRAVIAGPEIPSASGSSASSWSCGRSRSGARYCWAWFARR